MSTSNDSHFRDTHAEHVHVSLKTYTTIFVLLMILLFLTIGAAFVNFGHHSINITVALLIAVLKAGLVVLFFMHVKYASRLTQIFVACAFLWLIIMFVLTFSDYLSRPLLPGSAGWNNSPIMKMEKKAEALEESNPQELHPEATPSHSEESH